MSEPSTGRLEGRPIIVTGASRGIGRAIAERLCREGARLVLTAAPDESERLAEAAAACGNATGFAFDLADPETAPQLVRICLEEHGGLFGLVNNAARHFPGAVADIGLADWDRALRVNLTAAMLLCQAALSHLVPAGRGVIVNISSQRAFASGPGEPAYESAKAGLLALTRSLAVDYGPAGIRSNCITPGLILSERAVEWLDGAPHRREAMSAVSALRRSGEPAEIAAVVAFLLSDDASLHQWRSDPGRRRHARRPPRKRGPAPDGGTMTSRVLRGYRVRDCSPPPPLWGRAFGVGVAGSEATETPTPEGRGVCRRALPHPHPEAGRAGEPETRNNRDALAGAAGFDTVEPGLPAGYPSPSFSRLGYASPRERALPHKRGGGE